MKRSGTVTKMEKLLLGLTALFLCGLLALHVHDRQQLRSVELAVETEREVSQEEILAEARTLNLNTASAEELTALPGIGEELARRIVEYREEHGSYENIEGIMKVSGIGEGKFEEIRERITVEETA